MKSGREREVEEGREGREGGKEDGGGKVVFRGDEEGQRREGGENNVVSAGCKTSERERKMEERMEDGGQEERRRNSQRLWRKGRKRLEGRKEGRAILLFGAERDWIWPARDSLHPRNLPFLLLTCQRLLSARTKQSRYISKVERNEPSFLSLISLTKERRKSSTEKSDAFFRRRSRLLLRSLV